MEVIEIRQTDDNGTEKLIFKGHAFKYADYLREKLDQRIDALTIRMQELERNQGAEHRDR